MKNDVFGMAMMRLIFTPRLFCDYWKAQILDPKLFSFQIFDAGDFSVLCSVISPHGERWLGGQFLDPEKVLVWTDEGKAYMYRLPAK